MKVTFDLTIDIIMMTKEEALRRFKATDKREESDARINFSERELARMKFKAAKQTKKDAVAALEQKMKQAYEERTGLKANYVVTL